MRHTLTLHFDAHDVLRTHPDTGERRTAGATSLAELAVEPRACAAHSHVPLSIHLARMQLHAPCSCR